MAIAAMRKANKYSVEEINIVAQMILDTKVDVSGKGALQTENTELSKYLLDADLSNFGRDDFFERMDARVLEIQAVSHTQVYAQTLILMKIHKWKSKVANARRQVKKEENMKTLEEHLSSSS